MKCLTVSDKTLLAGDEVVDLLIDYATLLGQSASADSVEITAIGSDGAEAIVTFLLNPGVTIVAETSPSAAPAPDNTKAEQYLHDRITSLRGVGAGPSEDIAGAAVWNDTVTE